MSSFIGVGKKCALSDIVVSKLIFHIDDDFNLHKTNSFENRVGFSKLKEREKAKYDGWIKNMERNKTKNITLPRKYINPTDIKSDKLFESNILIDEAYNILYPIFLFKKPTHLLIAPDNLPKVRSIHLSSRNFKVEDNDLNSYEIFNNNNNIYENKTIKEIISKVYDAVHLYISNKNDPAMLKLFLELYPDRYKPRACWMINYEVYYYNNNNNYYYYYYCYKANKNQGFPSHIDLVSFCSVILAIKGDFNEKHDSLHITISNTKEINNSTNCKTIPLKDGEYIIFDRLYHSMYPECDREFQRVTCNIIF